MRQLEASDESDLLGFSPALENRIDAVEVLPPDDTRGLVDFNYKKQLTRLTATPPSFPEPTAVISGLDISISYRSRKGKRKNLVIEITDFPGEWLIDLAMIGMDFSTWNRWQCSLWETRRNGEEFAEFSKRLFALNLEDQHAVERIRDDYRRLLMTTRESEQGALLQPGQLCTKGHVVDVFPMACAELIDENPSALSEWLEQAFSHYVEGTVKPFFERYLSSIDRQVVLVDVQQVLTTSQTKLDETSEALSLILGKFDYTDDHSWFNWLRPEIDKTCFYATKADRVLPEDHLALRKILQRVARDAMRFSKSHGAAVVIDAIGAISTTTSGRTSDGEMLEGTDKNGKLQAYQNPSLLVDDELCFELNQSFVAPEFVPIMNAGIPLHIRLDSVLEQLVADWME